MAQLAGVANTSGIEQAKLAQTKAKAARVRAHATKMVKHHERAKTELAKLVRELKLSPAESSESDAWKSSSDRLLGALRGASGSNFDQTYVDGQVEQHQKALDTIDNQLLPSAQSEKVKAALQAARGATAAHLDEAKSIQAELAKAP